MRSVVAALVAVFLLVSCGPAFSDWSPGERRGPIERPSWWNDSPVVPPSVEPPVVVAPPVTRPVEPPAEPPVSEPETPVEPPIVTPEPPAPPVTPDEPVRPPEPRDDGCWTLTLPQQAAVERIDKCPRQPAQLTRRR